MAQFYIGLNRGQEGFKQTDFTTGASTGNTDMEFRLDDSRNLTRKDVKNALCAIERWFESNIFTKGNAPPL